MRVRYIDNPTVEGSVTQLNFHGVGECILWFDDGSATSEEIKLLEPVEGTRDQFLEYLHSLEP